MRNSTRRLHQGFPTHAKARRFAQSQYKEKGVLTRTHVFRSGFQYCVNVVKVPR